MRGVPGAVSLAFLMSEPQYLMFTGFPIGKLRTNRILAAVTPGQIKSVPSLALASSAGLPILFSQISVESASIYEFLSTVISRHIRPTQSPFLSPQVQSVIQLPPVFRRDGLELLL
jgi:hypothetical protein